MNLSLVFNAGCKAVHMKISTVVASLLATLDKDGNSFSCPLNTLDKDGNSFTVSNAVLDKDGNSFSV